MASTKPQILFRTTDAQKEALQRLSEETGAPISWHIRQAIDQYLKEKGVAVVETYRAAIYRHPEGEEQVMTSPEDAHLSDDELFERAMAEAHSAGLIGPEWPQVPDAEFRRRLYVGEWAER